MKEVSETTTRYYKNFVGYDRLLEPQGPILFSETHDLDAFYRATFHSSGQLLALEKVGVSRRLIDFRPDQLPRQGGLRRVIREGDAIFIGSPLSYGDTEAMDEYLVLTPSSLVNSKGMLVSRSRVFREVYGIEISFCSTTPTAKTPTSADQSVLTQALLKPLAEAGFNIQTAAFAAATVSIFVPGATSASLVIGLAGILADWFRENPKSKVTVTSNDKTVELKPDSDVEEKLEELNR